MISAPRDSRNARFSAVLFPPFALRNTRTDTPPSRLANLQAISNVASSDPSSTTITSRCGYRNARIDSSVAAMRLASLNAGTRTDTSGRLADPGRGRTV